MKYLLSYLQKYLQMPDSTIIYNKVIFFGMVNCGHCHYLILDSSISKAVKPFQVTTLQCKTTDVLYSMYGKPREICW